MKVLAVDYDGVIVDSVLESLFIGHNAYLRLYGPKKKQGFGGYPFTFQNWADIQGSYKKEIEYYRSLRPYIRGATDYGLIQKLMEEGTVIDNQQDFDCYRSSVEFNFENYQDAFYQERKRLQEENFKEWLKLTPPYRNVIQGIRQFSKQGVKVVIATSNRREYIAKAFLPSYYNITVEPEDILDNRFGEDKSSQMRYICSQYGVSCPDIYFIDDQLAHLLQTRVLGIQVFLAGWSYATKNQKFLAEKEGISIISKENDFLFTLKPCLLPNPIDR